MASQILTRFKQRVESLELQPSSGGCFELTIDGDLVYSKLATGAFPAEGQILDSLQTRIA